VPGSSSISSSSIPIVGARGASKAARSGGASSAGGERSMIG